MLLVLSFMGKILYLSWENIALRVCGSDIVDQISDGETGQANIFSVDMMCAQCASYAKMALDKVLNVTHKNFTNGLLHHAK